MPDTLGYFAPEDVVVAIFAGLWLAVLAGIALFACRKAKRRVVDGWRSLSDRAPGNGAMVATKITPKAH